MIPDLENTLVQDVENDYVSEKLKGWTDAEVQTLLRRYDGDYMRVAKAMLKGKKSIDVAPTSEAIQVATYRTLESLGMVKDGMRMPATLRDLEEQRKAASTMLNRVVTYKLISQIASDLLAGSNDSVSVLLRGDYKRSPKHGVKVGKSVQEARKALYKRAKWLQRKGKDKEGLERIAYAYAVLNINRVLNVVVKSAANGTGASADLYTGYKKARSDWGRVIQQHIRIEKKKAERKAGYADSKYKDKGEGETHKPFPHQVQLVYRKRRALSGRTDTIERSGRLVHVLPISGRR